MAEHRINADNVLFAFGMFAILMVTYGQSIPSANVQNSMTQLFAPWPTFQDTTRALTGPGKGCGSLDFGCQASAGIAQATAYIGAVIGYPAVLAGSVLSRISAFGSLLGFVTFGSATSFGAVPLGSLFLLALFLVVAVELFRLFRGSPSGL
ncbi:hypothetical protein E6H23_04295 [Candidatus Bathyarchaeota archaeon]|nr:MAG: hypothetical protein E6H23_04295 [Candidatus Bathyarchaeota archaeon]